MSVRSYLDALSSALEGAAMTTGAGEPMRSAQRDSHYPVTLPAWRLFAVLSTSAPIDAGIVGTVEREYIETLSVDVVYVRGGPSTQDDRRTVAEDAITITRVLIDATLWGAHLDQLDVSAATIDDETGADGDLVGYTLRVPFSVHYRG
jgi:hypothetical protein